MRLLRIIALVLAIAAPAAGQDADEDRTFLERQIAGLLSGAGREVTITGFRGALSSRATMERMTIADDSGVWFVMEDATLDWSRAALLRGRLDVADLGAARIEIARLPKSGPTTLSPADAEARPFALPELPVSVSIGRLGAGAVTLGEAVLGEAVTLSIEARLTLAEGAGAVDLAVRREGREDRLLLDAGFDNASRVLRLALDFDEAAGGLVARALRVPGAPALRLRAGGAAPLADFEAKIALSSDGTDRLGGTVRIAALGEGGAEGYGFATDLEGDLRPLVIADLHPFFGASAALTLAGEAGADGRVRIDALRMASAGMTLSGDLSLGADGWPERFGLTGRLGGEGPMRLPLAGPATLIDSARVEARFDAARGAAWQADIALAGLNRGGLRVGAARIGADGTITGADGAGVRADIVFAAQEVGHDDAGLARALGPMPQGALSLGWRPGAPVEVDRLTLTSGDASLAASGTIDGLESGFAVAGRAALSGDDLRRFAALAGREGIEGAASVTVQGRGSLLGGDFDIELSASARDLRTGTARLDPLLAGRSTIGLAARRGTEGIAIERLDIRNGQLAAAAEGRLGGQSGALTLTADLSDVALAEPRLSGPARLETQVDWQAGGALAVSRLVLEVAGATLSAEGTLDTATTELPGRGRVTLIAPDLSRFAQLSARPLAGSTELSLEGVGEIAGRRLEADIALAGKDLHTGLAGLDRLLGGRLDLDGRVEWAGGVPFVERLSLAAARLSAKAAAPEPGAPVAVTLDLADLGDLAPGIAGPATLSGTLALLGESGEEMEVDLAFAGPGGMAARIGGRIAEFGRRLALSASGTAPLSLANGVIAPRSVQGPARFDLRLDGAPALAALSGEIGIGGARVSVPGVATAIGNLAGTVRLGGGMARLDLTGDAGRGGRFAVIGPVGLAPPFAASLEAALEGLGLADPELFETTLFGRIAITGPLAGGARIGGAIRLGPTELRVPSGSAASVGDIPAIRHVGASAAVLRTLRRAGLTGAGTAVRPAANFPLDLVIDAPGRVFVRGRGLDAELGGQLRLGGTTADVTASGVFDLIRGRIDILARRLDLTEGQIDLRGALDPWLRFVARTQTSDLTIDIVLEGLASDPEISFASSPDLPQEEILAQLLFGRSFDKMSAFQAAQLVAAVATLSGQRSGGLTGRLRGALGLSDFDVTSTEEGATRVTAGAYLSENIYSEVSADSAGESAISLNLDLSPSVTVRGSASNSGETGLGIFFEKDY